MTEPIPPSLKLLETREAFPCRAASSGHECDSEGRLVEVWGQPSDDVFPESLKLDRDTKHIALLPAFKQGC